MDSPILLPPATLPHPLGARAWIWKQDPSISVLGTRQVFLPGTVLAGPRDARIVVGEPGAPLVEPDARGDFQAPPDSPAFDAVHTFAVVRQTLTMYERALHATGHAGTLCWHWFDQDSERPLRLYPHGLPDVMNAFYSRTQGCLTFGDFLPGNGGTRIHTCRSLDIVAHETAHAMLDGIKPHWLEPDAPPQTGALHEAFGDLSAILLVLSQLDLCEAVVASTRADLHDTSFLPDIAEQFGAAMGNGSSLRSANNTMRMSQAGSQVHALSQVFSGAMYDLLADLFEFERSPLREDDAAVLHRVAGYVSGLLLRALMQAPAQAASYADVVNAMLQLVRTDGKAPAYGERLAHQFARREVIETPNSLALAPMACRALVCDAPGAQQNRHHCCGTFHLPEFTQVSPTHRDTLDSELAT